MFQGLRVGDQDKYQTPRSLGFAFGLTLVLILVMTSHDAERPG